MRVLITGGAGFIGTNCALRFAEEGHEVCVFDNLSRRGSAANIEYLKQHGLKQFVYGDVRSYDDVLHTLRPGFDVVIHLAAQVAVTTSVERPRHDFEVNALGTFNVLEGLRTACPDAFLIYASTNKVYGELSNIAVEERNGRYQFVDTAGVSEAHPIDFHSPYGCSKGAADQYVRDYARIYGLRAVVFRQSCIYGPWQFGIEDQGWVAWFTIAAALGLPITIYGDGKQVRDVLYVDDLADVFRAAIANPEAAQGKIYNIGGGPENQISLLELLEKLRAMLGKDIEYSFGPWRPGDQKVFVCDISRVKAELRWEPQTTIDEGLEKLVKWVADNQEIIRSNLFT